MNEEYVQLYCMCLEEWSEEIKEGLMHKERWYARMKDRGLRVKLALDDAGVVGGMIQYLPIEHSFIEGKDLYFIPCIWVHGHKQGRGVHQKKGMGKALLQAAEEDARALGAKGIAGWGLLLPVWMRSSWYRKQGYRKADRLGIQVLMWKSFTADAEPPRWFRQKKTPVPEPGKVTITAFINGWCPFSAVAMERAKRIAQEFQDKVIYKEINTAERDTLVEWGIADGLFINDKAIRFVPPPPYEKIKKLITKKIKS